MPEVTDGQNDCEEHEEAVRAATAAVNAYMSGGEDMTPSFMAELVEAERAAKQALDDCRKR